jgi:hypothetical protein
MEQAYPLAITCFGGDSCFADYTGFSCLAATPESDGFCAC